MLFNSFQYALFLPIVFILYWLIPHKFRWGIILVSSYFFYMCWNAEYLLLIVFVTMASYIAAWMINKSKSKDAKRKCVVAVAIICLTILFIFKYFNFMYDSIKSIMGLFSVSMPDLTLVVLLPVGISFYTFQAIGYVVDVYRGDVELETHIGKYAAFLAFFPQLVAGPIERSSNLLPQLKKEQFFDYNQATYGLKLMAWGYFKKIVVADTLAMYVDKVYADLHAFPGFSRFLVIFFFSVQIYCDFSGYSDIARGTAKLFGIELMENFKCPYFSKSIKEFWKRWHISLSTWFGDYVYIPLGGNRVGKVRNALNLMITFLLSGIWHGASWTFLAWGGLHGSVQIAEKWFGFSKKSDQVEGFAKVFHIILNFIVVSVLWVFFRAQSFKDAAYMLIFWYQHFDGSPFRWINNGIRGLGMDITAVIEVTLMLLLLFLYDYISLKRDVIDCIGKWKVVPRWAIYVGIVILIFWLAPMSSAEFIYFDF